MKDWFKKHLWQLISFIVSVVVGVLGAVLMPTLLPLQTLAPTINSLLWGFFLFLSTLFLTTVIRVPSRVNEILSEHKDEIAKATYTSFYTLLSDKKVRENFKNFEIQTRNASGADPPLRGVLLDFVVHSLASIGKNGFAVVDAKVDTYVKYISETVPKAKQAMMTCVVRPYWFVVDEIRSVALPPYEKKKDEYGKGEHLRFLRKGSSRYQRWLILDEHILAEMFLTAYIDKHFVENSEAGNCPVCKACGTSKSVRCPFHTDRINERNINDIPEIWWFRKDVNEERGVQLLYTLVRVNRRETHKELEDRVFIHPKLPLDIRFNFINLENGILRIRWGEEAKPLALIEKFRIKINPETGKEDDLGHKFYNNFNEVLKSELNDKMIKHLDLLAGQVDTYFNLENTEKIESEDAPERQKLLANGANEFSRCLAEDIIEQLITDLNDMQLNEIYALLVQFYRENHIPKIAYIVTHDPIHPEYPVRIARWKFNWDGNENSKDGIINAPD